MIRLIYTNSRHVAQNSLISQIRTALDQLVVEIQLTNNLGFILYVFKPLIKYTCYNKSRYFSFNGEIFPYIKGR